MIPRAYIDAWRSHAPWRSDAQVEQDLIICRALIEIFQHPVLSKQLVFRGGTALHKLFLSSPRRYSEDIDLVRIEAGPIGPIFDGLRETLEPLLGKSRRKQGPGVVKGGKLQGATARRLLPARLIGAGPFPAPAAPRRPSGCRGHSAASPPL